MREFHKHCQRIRETLKELEAAHVATDDARIVHWSGILTLAAGELASECLTDIAHNITWAKEANCEKR